MEPKTYTFTTPVGGWAVTHTHTDAQGRHHGVIIGFHKGKGIQPGRLDKSGNPIELFRDSRPEVHSLYATPGSEAHLPGTIGTGVNLAKSHLGGTPQAGSDLSSSSVRLLKRHGSATGIALPEGGIPEHPNNDLDHAYGSGLVHDVISGVLASKAAGDSSISEVHPDEVKQNKQSVMDAIRGKRTELAQAQTQANEEYDRAHLASPQFDLFKNPFPKRTRI